MPTKRQTSTKKDKSPDEVKSDNSEKAAQRLKYSRKAEVLYQQADELLRNAIQGDFPRDDAFQARKRGNRT